MVEKSVKMVVSRLLLAAAIVLLVAPSLGRAEDEAQRETDVVVYGSSPAGIISAIAAAQSGSRVDLIEPLEHIGGVIANGGLCTTDLGDSRTVGGLAREFFDRIHRYYVAAYGEKSPQVQAARTAGIAGACPEPHVAEQVFETWLKEYPQLRLHRNRRLESIRMQGKTIRSIVCVATKGPPAHDEFAGKVFIDASYTGDLLAKAGVSYRIGREGAGEYDESMAPKKADPRIMCYNFRMTLTNRAENRRSVEKPAHYDPANYRRYPSYAAAPAAARGVFRTDWWRLPNDKIDANVADLPGNNYGYPEGDLAVRRRIEQENKDFSLGYLYFLQNDPEVPKILQEGARQWGLPKDEFVDNGNFPREIYVREARRMIGAYVMRQSDQTQDRTKPDGIALGSYNMDCHAVGIEVTASGKVQFLGQTFRPIKPYEIPYRILVPKPDQARNLLVPVCPSVTHVALASLRMEPVFMMLGQACGVAADMAARSGASVQTIDVAALRKTLQHEHAIVAVLPELTAEFTWKPAHPRPGEEVQFQVAEQRGVKIKQYRWNFSGDGRVESTEASPRFTFAAAKGTLVSLSLQGADGSVSKPVQKLVPVGDASVADVALVTGDSRHVVINGLWGGSGQWAFFGECYYHDANAAKGQRSADFKPKLPKAGRYRVYVSSIPAAGRSRNTPARILHDGGAADVRIDQSHADNPFALTCVGEYSLTPGHNGTVTISNEGTEGYVTCNTVRWIWIGP